MKRWPVIRHIRYTYHVWVYFFRFDFNDTPDPMKLEYFAGIKEGAW